MTGYYRLAQCLRLKSRIKKRSPLWRKMLCFSLFLLVSVSSYAEGSRDLYPAGAQGGRAFLLSGSNPSSVNPFPTLGTHYVYVKKGEWISMASSMQGFQGSTDRRIKLFD